MDFKKIIEEQKRNMANKEKAKEVLDKLSGKLQELADKGTKKANELLDNSKEFIDKKQQELENAIEDRFSKIIYGDCISYIENIIIKENLKEDKQAVVIKKDKLEDESALTIGDIIVAVAPKNVNATIYTQSKVYIDTLFDVIVAHFSLNEQLEVSTKEDAVVITIKEIPVEEVEAEVVEDTTEDVVDK